MKLIVIAVLVCFIAGSECRGLKEEFTWSRISYAGFGSTQSRVGYYGGSSSPDAIQFPESNTEDASNFGGSYIYGNNLLTFNWWFLNFFKIEDESKMRGLTLIVYCLFCRVLFFSL